MLGHDPLSSQALGETSLASVPAGGPVGEQLFPKSAPRKQFGYCETVFTNLLLTTLAVAATTTVFREPLYTQRNVVRPQVIEARANLLTTTLAPSGQAQAPFSQASWPNPPVIKNQPQFEYRNTLLTALGTPPGTPIVSVQWPNPIIKRSSVFSGFEYIPTAHTLLIGPYYPSDTQWPNPTIIRRQEPFLFPNLVNTTFTDPVVASTNTTRPPLYTRHSPIRHPAVGFAQNNLQGALSTVVGTPLRPMWIDNPLRAKWTQPEQVTNRQPLTGAGYNYQYAPSDNQWPNPILFKARWNTPDFLPINTTQIMAAYAYQYSPSDNQWANPTGSRAIAPYLQDTPNLLNTTLGSTTPDPTLYCDYHRHYRRISYR